MRARVRAVVAVALATVLLPEMAAPQTPPPARRRPVRRPPAAAVATPDPADEAAVYDDAARRAWRFIDASIEP